MAFCPNCGTQAAGRFCPNCGTDVNAAGAPGAGAGSSAAGSAAYAAPMGASSVQAGGLTDNVASALCYLLWLLTGVIFLVLAPYNRNRTVRFHAFQSIFATLAIIALNICLMILSMALHTIHLGLLSVLIWLVYPIAMLGLWIYLMFSAYNGKKVVLPVIGPLAEKQADSAAF